MNKSKKIDNIYFIIISLSIIVITYLHYSTVLAKWEIHIFYRRLYYFPIILSAFKYRQKGGIITSLIVSILYSPHLWFKSNDIIISINQYLEIILFIAIGTITGRLVELDYKKKIELEKKIIEITRLQNFTKNIVDSINTGIISIDNNHNITYVNKEIKKLFKDKCRNGIKITKIIDDKNFIEAINQVRIQNKPINNLKLEIEIEEYNLFLDFKILPLTDILDRVLGIVLVIENKSDIKFLESQAERSDRLAMVGELASGVAHEVRNPMGIIKTISQVLKKEVKDSEIREGLEIIEKEIDRANRVIKSLLDFAKPDTKIIEKISLNVLVDEVLLITKKFIEKEKIIIDVTIKDEINISGDKEKLKQVFINIIFNSVQAISNGGKITITISKIGNWVNLSFKDNGIGISNENLKKIFNPFFTTKDTGTGLGLAISNRIIEDHNGYINIESEIGKGTEVNIFLPID